MHWVYSLKIVVQMLHQLLHLFLVMHGFDHPLNYEDEHISYRHLNERQLGESAN